jgi:predicted metal-dependent phosphoesterase TrpH
MYLGKIRLPAIVLEWRRGHMKNCNAEAITFHGGKKSSRQKRASFGSQEIVHRSGGVALIAHPGRGQSEPEEFTYYTPDMLDQVRAEIPLDGIEVYYPTHPPEFVEMYLAYARQHNLLISAGSDSHGPPGRLPIKYRAEFCRSFLEQVGIGVQQSGER